MILLIIVLMCDTIYDSNLLFNDRKRGLLLLLGLVRNVDEWRYIDHVVPRTATTNAICSIRK